MHQWLRLVTIVCLVILSIVSWAADSDQHPKSQALSKIGAKWLQNQFLCVCVSYMYVNLRGQINDKRIAPPVWTACVQYMQQRSVRLSFLDVCSVSVGSAGSPPLIYHQTNTHVHCTHDNGSVTQQENVSVLQACPLVPLWHWSKHITVASVSLDRQNKKGCNKFSPLSPGNEKSSGSPQTFW